MNNTGIEWTDITWNPVTGCTKVSQGCKNCYAERVFPRVYGKDRFFDRHPETGDKRNRVRAFTDVMLHPYRLGYPLHMRKGKRIFVNSMSDLFHESVPDSFIDMVFAVMALSPQHAFQVLTKRPDRMYHWMRGHTCPTFRRDQVIGCAWEMLGKYPKFKHRDVTQRQWPLPNVWLGVSVEDQSTADERIPLLLKTPSAVRFISAEPLLGPVTLDRFTCDSGSVPGPYGIGGVKCHYCGGYASGRCAHLDLVIAGGESGFGARPSHPDWFRSLRDQCAEAGVKFFFKQWGEWAPSSHLHDHISADVKYLKINGVLHDYEDAVEYDASDAAMVRVGKKAAGRTLHGREHSELPA